MIDQYNPNRLNIVVRGYFVPTIFQPAWLASQGLIRDKEAEEAKIELIHREMTQFSLDWVTLQINGDKFQAISELEAYFEPVRDLVISIFSLLGHTPLRAIGINRDFVHHFNDEKDWHRVGDTLVPKNYWTDTLQKPGMLNLAIKGERPDQYEGYIQTTVQPRPKMGVYVEVNDHYILHDANNQPVSAAESQLVSVLKNGWEDSLSRAHQIVEDVIQLGYGVQ